MIDWEEGDYGRIAADIGAASEAAVDAARVAPGQRVLDVGCGTGNAALAAAARGAIVTGVDPAERLLELARRRAAGTGAEATFVAGDAADLPVPDGAFDVALSVFGVIFAGDGAQAVAEMARAVRSGGRLALATWVAAGAIHEAGEVLRGEFPAGDGPPQRWGDPEWVAGLLVEAGARDVVIEGGEIVFRAASPEAWLADQVGNHPAWRHVRRELGEERWARVRRDCLAILARGNEDASAFQVTSRYTVLTAARA